MNLPLPQIVEEARRIVAAAHARELPLRLIGGVAIGIRAGDALHPGLAREYKDIDLVTLKGKGKASRGFLEEMGYSQDRQFNAAHGHDRLLFFDLAHARQVDVFVGAFRMCHTIPITERIALDPNTVPLAELLMTKLQIVQLNEKDLRDIVTILHHHEVAEHDGGTINSAHIAHLCADDWGLWRTSKMNIERAREGLPQYDISPREQEQIRERLDNLWERIEGEPKPRVWRLRDRIGDRKRWYEEPEEVGG
jgi:hypothetical protein